MKAKTIDIPHNFTPRNYQWDLVRAINNGYKRLIWVAHRRSGKDKTAINILAKQAIKRKGSYYYFLPTYSQGRKIIWDGMDRDGFKFIDHIPKELVASKNETEMKIRLVNGSLIQVIGTDKYDSIVGTNPLGCIFSEYSLQNPKAWEFVSPILAENNGWALFLYTPRGMNHGWKLLQQAKDSKHWFSQILTVEDTKAISEEALEEAKKEMPEDLFQQEYYCRFLEGAGQFFKWDDEDIWSGQLEPQHGRTYKVGADIAKHQDWTVLTPIDLHNFYVGKPDRFNQLSYDIVETRIENSSRKFNNARITLDSSGVGEPVHDNLSNKGLPIDPFVFTERSRADLLKNLQIRLANHELKLPDYEPLLNELRSFRYELSERGKLRLTVPEGLHDDCVMSLALAVWDIGLPLGEHHNQTLDQPALYNTDYS